MKNSINEILSLMDRIDSSFILNEAVDPELIYSKYYSDIPRDTFIRILKKDPFTKFGDNKIKHISVYGKWLLELYRTDETFKASMRNETDSVSDMLTMYNQLLDSKKRYGKSLPLLKKNLAKLENEENPSETTLKHIEDLRSRIKNSEDNMPTIEDNIMNYNSYDELIGDISSNIGKELKQSDKEIKQNGAEIIYNDGHWVMVETTSRAANQLYGKGAVWCTTMRDRDDYWKSYSEHGKILIIRNLNDPNELYQLYTEYNGNNCEFRDKENNDISTEWTHYFPGELCEEICNYSWGVVNNYFSNIDSEDKDMFKKINDSYSIYNIKDNYAVFNEKNNERVSPWSYYPEIIKNYVIMDCNNPINNYDSLMDSDIDLPDVCLKSFYNGYNYDEKDYYIFDCNKGERFNPEELDSITSCETHDDFFIIGDEYSNYMVVNVANGNNFVEYNGNRVFNNVYQYKIEKNNLLMLETKEDKYILYTVETNKLFSINGKCEFDEIKYKKNDNGNEFFVIKDDGKKLMIDTNFNLISDKAHEIIEQAVSTRQIGNFKVYLVPKTTTKTNSDGTVRQKTIYNAYDSSTYDMINFNGVSDFRAILTARDNYMFFATPEGYMYIFDCAEKRPLIINGNDVFVFKSEGTPNGGYNIFIYNKDETEMYILNDTLRTVLSSSGEFVIKEKVSLNDLLGHTVNNKGYILKFSNNDLCAVCFSVDYLNSLTYMLNRTNLNFSQKRIFENEGVYAILLQHNYNKTVSDAISDILETYDKSKLEKKNYIKNIIKEELKKRLK